MFKEHAPEHVSWALLCLDYADQFGLTEADLDAIWGLGFRAAMQEHHDDPTKHVWLDRATVKDPQPLAELAAMRGESQLTSGS